MRAALGFISLLAVLGTGYYIYTAQLGKVPQENSLSEQINMTAIRTDLLSFAQAERLYLAANGSYGTLEQLRSAGSLNQLPGNHRAGYAYEAEIDGASHFRIIAKPSKSDSSDLPVLSIDETMRITS